MARAERTSRTIMQEIVGGSHQVSDIVEEIARAGQ
ncbi:MAG: hypothetical protein GAK38_03339 [Xylophilus sp.]|nr:MAG: hypothetical protein GAK38_03339 [Xylophilus sp.]